MLISHIVVCVFVCASPLCPNIIAITKVYENDFRDIFSKLAEFKKVLSQVVNYV